MPVQDLASITVGPLDVKIYSEELGGCYLTGCLNTARLNVPRAMIPVMCSALDAPVDYYPAQPGMGLSVNAKELSALNMALAWGSGGSIISGSSIDQLVGNPAAASTNADPAEFHVVRLPASGGPWNFTLNLENRQCYNTTGQAASGFVKATDIEVYFAQTADNNGTANIVAATALYESNALTGTASDAAKGSFYFSDPCLGQLKFGAIPDAAVVQFTWDAASPPYYINGKRVVVEDDVQHGDTVALVGVAYKWGFLADAAGTLIPFANQQAVLFGNNTQIKPVSLRGVHLYRKNKKRLALVIEMWKAYNMTGFSTGFDAQTTNEVTLDYTFTAVDDSLNHPDSPLGWVKKISSTTDLSIVKLLA